MNIASEFKQLGMSHGKISRLIAAGKSIFKATTWQGRTSNRGTQLRAGEQENQEIVDNCRAREKLMKYIV
jgi:hypothetical protein